MELSSGICICEKETKDKEEESENNEIKWINLTCGTEIAEEIKYPTETNLFYPMA
jgi:hypothetical protein